MAMAKGVRPFDFRAGGFSFNHFTCSAQACVFPHRYVYSSPSATPISHANR